MRPGWIAEALLRLRPVVVIVGLGVAATAAAAAAHWMWEVCRSRPSIRCMCMCVCAILDVRRVWSRCRARRGGEKADMRRRYQIEQSGARTAVRVTSDGVANVRRAIGARLTCETDYDLILLLVVVFFVWWSTFTHHHLHDVMNGRGWRVYTKHCTLHIRFPQAE